MEIAVLGAGTYGSYVINSLIQKYPNAHITLFDVGDKTVKNEKEIGFYSSLKRSVYKGLTDGRYFGFGGASDKWGGQLLTYTENDFKKPNKFMEEVIALDKKSKNEMLAKFKIKNDFPENHVSEELFTKTGVWLSALHRNFFHWFKIDKRKQVNILSHCRVIKLNSQNGKDIDGVVYLENGIEKEKSYDFYFLTSGAFESARILLSSNLVTKDKIYFSDHLSQRVFKIKNSTIIGKEDFVFRMRGTSLITKRMIGEVNNCSFYIHPVFNLQFPFFESVKEVLFKHHFQWKYIWNIFRDIPNVIGFVWAVLILRRMYVMNNEWFLYIDIENPTQESYITLSKEKDKFGIQGLDVYYNIGIEAVNIYQKATDIAINHLKRCNVEYEILTEEINVQTCEDIYHPYGMFDFKDIQEYFTRWNNMLVVTTGCLNRSGGINPTAALLPVIDEFIKKNL
ncbi:hypothetical protein [Bacteroides stercoris]|jgi:hypothetical protein|uniref:Uncharacterized protein n=1 Tax=Bacteroides stercoris TaxID=46506 RepID=A0A7J5LIP0_BACSE|nr:hypothetical protein [Bacteroides stercoris]KAB5316922.1 hypothetical protein F9949_14530 [Bacteroides stercoris]KAB5324288.1 hypothetical protein F9950_16945 [Bacteroides stercoris]KAB5331218.1 hypothetical protein F9944_16990 [Bacteroides stercoris]KAB5331239.1 hypothetical protein F9956_16820 [Bacteroides stercoris]